jgi:hypothetical protein
MRSIHRYWFVAMLLGGSGVVWCAENHAPAGGLQSGPQQMVYIAVPIVSAPRDLKDLRADHVANLWPAVSLAQLQVA